MNGRSVVIVPVIEDADDLASFEGELVVLCSLEVIEGLDLPGLPGLGGGRGVETVGGGIQAAPLLLVATPTATAPTPSTAPSPRSLLIL